MKMKWIIAIAAIMLLITACSTQKLEEQKTSPSIENVGVVKNEKAQVQTIELRLDKNEVFNPSTIVIAKGEKTRLHFLNTNPYVFNIPELGIVEYAGGNYLDLKVDKAGSYVFECSDCNKTHPGVLKVI